MIATLNGILKVKKNNFVIIEVNGVGYELLVSKKTINNLGQLNQPVSFLTDLQIKDDKIPAEIIIAGIAQASIDTAKPCMTLVPSPVSEDFATVLTGRYSVDV